MQHYKAALQAATSASYLHLQPVQDPRAHTSAASTSSGQGAGYIDLVGVSEAYSGALKAARHRVDDATSDSALARALLEKADLERQLKVCGLDVCALSSLAHGHHRRRSLLDACCVLDVWKITKALRV